MEKTNETNKELGRSRAGVRTSQFGKQGATDDTKWQISVSPTSRWANRFIIAAIVQGALAAGVTSYLLYDAVYGSPGPARIVAGGSAGTWLTVGYLGYIMLGPLAAAVTALFYQHLSQSPCAVQGLAERFRLASSRSDERRGRGSNMAYDERRLQRRSLDHNPGGSEPDMEHRTSTWPSPRAGTKWVPVIHRTIRSSSDHRSLRRRTGLRRRLETRPQENSCNYIIER